MTTADQPEQPPVEGAPVQPFSASRLLVVVTGSAAASSLPAWVSWLRSTYPDLHVRVVMTPSARGFVTPMSLDLRVADDLEVDSWDDSDTARHVTYASWPDVVLVYPATFHFTARYALGLADSPMMLALQCTEALVAVAPALPPGGLDSPALRSHWSTLASRPRTVLIPPMEGMSLTTGLLEGWVPPPLTEVLRLVEERWQQLAAPVGEPAGGDEA